MAEPGRRGLRFPNMKSPDTDQVTTPEDVRHKSLPERGVLIAVVVVAALVVAGLLAFAA